MIDSQRVTWTVLAMFLNGSSVLEKQLYVTFVDKSLITSLPHGWCKRLMQSMVLFTFTYCVLKKNKIPVSRGTTHIIVFSLRSTSFVAPSNFLV